MVYGVRRRDLIPTTWMEGHPFWSPEGETPELPVLATVAALGAPTLATLQALVGEAAARDRPYGLDAPAEIFWEVNPKPVRPGFLLTNGGFSVDLSGVETDGDGDRIFEGKNRGRVTARNVVGDLEIRPQRRTTGPLSRVVRAGVKVVRADARGYLLRIPPL